MADPVHRWDYGRAGITHAGPTNETFVPANVAFHKMIKWLFAEQGPPSTSLPTQENVRQWVCSVPTPTRPRARTVSSDPGPPEPVAPPSPPRAFSAMKRFVAPNDQLCGPERGELRDNQRAGRSGRKKSRGATPPPAEPAPSSPLQPRSALKRVVDPVWTRTRQTP